MSDNRQTMFKSYVLASLIICWGALATMLPSGFVGNTSSGRYPSLILDSKKDIGPSPQVAQAFKLNTNLSLVNASYLGQEAGALAGCAVAGVGDINHDGYDDFVVGAYKQSTVNGPNSGKVYLILGNATKDIRSLSSLSLASASFIGESTYGCAGYSVAGVGDVNNDGTPDILIGAYNMTCNGIRCGKSYLLYGGPGIFHQDLNLSLANASFMGETALDRAGYCISGAGDVNNDGFADILIGAPYHATQAGKVYLFYGNSTASGSLHPNLNVTASNASFDGVATYDYLGSAIAGLGDVDGDGYSDFIIGAYGNDDGGDSAGRAYLIYGASTGTLTNNMPITPASGASFIGEGSGDRLGYSVAGPGDVSADGHPDILIGAYTHTGSLTNQGKAYLFYGGAPGILHSNMAMTEANASFLGKASYDYAGYSLAGAGDVNRDGRADFLIGAYGSNTGGVGAGEIYLLYGNETSTFSRDMSLAKANASFYGETSGESAGACETGVGDVDNDGFADVVFGVQFNDIAGNNAGKVYLFLGPDAISPGNITDLLASSPGPDYVTLTWTAPGDDGSNGTVSGYIVKFSPSPITGLNFDAAQTFSSALWIPYSANGTQEVRFITGLEENHLYYFAIKGLDDWNNAGNMSNVVSLSTLNIAPSAISDLKVISVTPTTATLQWTAPGDDATAGSVTGYLVKSSKYPIDASNFSDATTYDTSLWGSFVSGGNIETRTVNGLSELTWYYFAIKAYDDVGNYGAISNVPHNITGSQSPAAVSDLELKFPTLGGFILSWTAPGDDGMTGTVAGYIVKYSTTPITDVNFSLADSYDQSWTSLAPGGSLESRTITGLNASTLYYFAIKAFDGVFNVGAISNIAAGYTATDVSIPQVTSPSDFVYVVGTIGHEVQWTLVDGTLLLPRYNISVDGTELVASAVWFSGQTITYSVDGLSLGRHSITIVVADGYGNINTDEVTLTVTSGEVPGPTLFELIAIALALGAIVAFLVVYINYRKKPAFRGEFKERKDIPVQGKTLPGGKGKPDSGASYKEPVPAGKEVQSDLEPIPPNKGKE